MGRNNNLHQIEHFERVNSKLVMMQYAYAKHMQNTYRRQPKLMQFLVFHWNSQSGERKAMETHYCVVLRFQKSENPWNEITTYMKINMLRV